MKKIILTAFLIAALLCICTGCNEEKYKEKYTNEKYTIYSEGGKCYLRLSDTFATKSVRANAHGCVLYDGPSGKTLSELQKKILRGDFEDTTLYNLILADMDGDNTLEILDPDECQIPILPKGMKISGVSWGAYGYGFDLTSEVGSIKHGHISWVSGEYFRAWFEQRFQVLSPEANNSIIDIVVSGRNVRVAHSTTDATEPRYVCYSLPGVNGYTLYVVEIYTLRDSTQPNIRTSDSIPTSIHICGANGEYYFYGSFSEPEARPSDEWLSSFGLMPFDATS